MAEARPKKIIDHYVSSFSLSELCNDAESLIKLMQRLKEFLDTAHAKVCPSSYNLGYPGCVLFYRSYPVLVSLANLPFLKNVF